MLKYAIMMKVYISKSNSCHIDNLIKVRGACIDSNFEIVEWTGNGYNRALKHSADILIAIGHRKSFKKRDSFIVGHGVAVEILDFKKPTYIYRPATNDLIVIREEDRLNIEVLNKDWQLNYLKFNLINPIITTFASLAQEYANKSKRVIETML